MIGSVLPYARARMVALGFTEHPDGFNFENIPKPRLGTAFHLEMGLAVGVSNNQSGQHIEVPFTVRAFRAPTRDPKSLIDQAADLGDTIINEFLKVENRLTQSGLKNMVFTNLEILPLAGSNDNGVVLKMDFTALVILNGI